MRIRVLTALCLLTTILLVATVTSMEQQNSEKPATVQPTAQNQAGGEKLRTDPNELVFVYQTPIVASNLIQVYLGAEGKYVRTTPFNLTGFELKNEGRRLTVHYDTTVSETDKKVLELQLAEATGKISGAPDAPKVEGLKWMKPYTITLELFDPTGKKKIAEGTERLVKNGFQRPLDFGGGKLSFTFDFENPQKIEDIRDHRVTITSENVVKTAHSQTAGFQVVVSTSMEAIEKVLGGLPKDGELISRNAWQSAVKYKTVQRCVKLIDADKEYEGKVMDLLQKSLAKDVDYSQHTDWATLGDKYFVWTPALGKLEIQPTKRDFESNELSLKENSRQAYKSKYVYLKEDIKNTGDFKRWFDQQKRKRSGEGSGGVNFDTEADLFDILSGSTSGAANYSFRNTVDNEDTNSGEYKTTVEIHNKIFRDEYREEDISRNFELKWKGINRISDYDAKKFNLAIVRSGAEVQREFTDLWRLQTVGVTSIPFRVASQTLSSAKEVTQDIADLRAKVAQLQAETVSVPKRFKVATKLVAVFTPDSKQAAKDFVVSINGESFWNDNARTVQLEVPKNGKEIYQGVFGSTDSSRFIAGWFVPKTPSFNDGWTEAEFRSTPGDMMRFAGIAKPNGNANFVIGAAYILYYE